MVVLIIVITYNDYDYYTLKMNGAMRCEVDEKSDKERIWWGHTFRATPKYTSSDPSQKYYSPDASNISNLYCNSNTK